jgi:hypothetical protein
MKTSIMKAMLFFFVEAAFDQTKDARIAQIKEKIRTYKTLIRTTVGGKASHRAAKVILDELEVGHFESFVQQPRRHPYVPN